MAPHGSSQLPYDTSARCAHTRAGRRSFARGGRSLEESEVPQQAGPVRSVQALMAYDPRIVQAHTQRAAHSDPRQGSCPLRIDSESVRDIHHGLSFGPEALGAWMGKQYGIEVPGADRPLDFLHGSNLSQLRRSAVTSNGCDNRGRGVDARRSFVLLDGQHQSSRTVVRRRSGVMVHTRHKVEGKVLSYLL